MNEIEENKKNEISVCMIVKDEELVITRAIICAKQFADEIIIVDTGSSDRTIELAEMLGVSIFTFKWCDDFSKARNFSFSKATKDYIFWMDADDYITPENIEAILKVKDELMYEEVDVVSMKYSLSLNSEGDTNTAISRNRLVKREKNYIWIGKIHEYLEVYGNVINSDIYIHHGKVKPIVDRNIMYYEKMKENGYNFTLRDRLYYGNELYYNSDYEEAIIQLRIFLESESGWSEDVKTATANIANAYEKLGRRDEVKDIILKSFKEDVPRADLCCKLADIFLDENKIHAAIFWYKIARESMPDKSNMGYDFKDYYTWIPTIQLVICYSMIENYKEAYYYNELASIYRNKSEAVENNKKYLLEKLKLEGIDIPKFTFQVNRIEQ